MSERDIQRLLELVERHLGKEWIAIGDWLRSLPDSDLTAIEQQLARRDFTPLLAKVDEAARTFATAAHGQYIRAGQAEAAYLDAQPALAESLVRFDLKNTRAILAAQRNELELVQGLTHETRETIWQVIVDGQAAGSNPRAIARDIRDSLTLNPQQARHVASYRRALEQGDYGTALSREARDARTDRTLRRLRRDGGELTEQQIDRMVEHYRSGKVLERAEAIARTESAKNVHTGLAEAHRQAIERGDVDADELVKEWIPGPRTRFARPDHRSSALLDQRPAVGEPFVLPSGARMMFPGDPAGGADEVVNCRCTYAVTFKPIEKRRSTLGPFPGESMYADIMRAAGRL